MWFSFASQNLFSLLQKPEFSAAGCLGRVALLGDLVHLALNHL